ncbi:NAD(P)H-binding protein [Streptomyces sp. NPDC020996]|uniref:NmrA family NAD(P)-binding protein n=1 Tax=Streptomyces sp. NPDC020996 TaxID=3154791 RepID=UPI0033C7AB49
MIVVTTPTGSIGRQLVGRLLDSGEPVRVIARDPSRLPARVSERAEVVQGSLLDSDVVRKAFAGADRVFLLVPPDLRAPSVEGHYLDCTRPACAAIVAHGVRQAVGLSSMGRGIGRNGGHLSAAHAKDALIADTGVAYRALRPPAFMENLLWQAGSIRSGGTFSWAHPGDRVLPAVATRDIAARAAELLLDGSWTGCEGVPVVGPDTLTPDGMAEVMSEVLRRPVRYRQAPLDDYRETMIRHGASEAWAQGLADMAVAQNNGAYDEEHRAAPPAPTSFRQWCEEVLRPAVLS